MFLLKAILSLQICLPKCGHQKLWLFPDFPETCSSNVPYVRYCCHRGAETQEVKMCFPVFKYEMDTLSHVMSFYMMDLFTSRVLQELQLYQRKKTPHQNCLECILLDAVKTADCSLVCAASQMPRNSTLLPSLEFQKLMLV